MLFLARLHGVGSIGSSSGSRRSLLIALHGSERFRLLLSLEQHHLVVSYLVCVGRARIKRVVLVSIVPRVASSSSQLLTISQTWWLEVVGSNGEGEEVDNVAPFALEWMATSVDLGPLW